MLLLIIGVFRVHFRLGLVLMLSCRARDLRLLRLSHLMAHLVMLLLLGHLLMVLDGLLLGSLGETLLVLEKLLEIEGVLGGISQSSSHRTHLLMTLHECVWVVLLDLIHHLLLLMLQVVQIVLLQICCLLLLLLIEHLGRILI